MRTWHLLMLSPGSSELLLNLTRNGANWVFQAKAPANPALPPVHTQRDDLPFPAPARDSARRLLPPEHHLSRPRKKRVSIMAATSRLGIHATMIAGSCSERAGGRVPHWGSKEWTLTRPSVAPDYQTAIAAIRATTLRRRTGPNQPGTAVAHGHHSKRQKALDGRNVCSDLDLVV